MCLLFVITGIDLYKYGFIDKDIQISYPLFAARGGSGEYAFISNSGKNIVITDNELNFKHRIEGGYADRDFYIASHVLMIDDGSIYVLDYSVAQDGKKIDKERIIKFNSKGEFEGYFYTTHYDEANRRENPSIKEILEIDGKIYLFSAARHSIIISSINLADGQISLVRSIPFENAADLIVDISSDENLQVSFTTKMADVWDERDGVLTQVYIGNDAKHMEFFSIPWSVQSYEDEIYFTDIGTREIYKLDAENNLYTVLEIGKVLDNTEIRFQDAPIMYNLNLLGDGEIFTAYHDKGYIFNEQGGVLLNDKYLVKSKYLMIKGHLTIFSTLICIVLIVYIIRRCKELGYLGKPSHASIIGLWVVTSTLLASCAVIYLIFQDINVRYEDEVINKMSSMARLISQSLDADAIKSIDSPDDYNSPMYKKIQKTITTALTSDDEWNDGIFCIIYREQNGVIHLIYQEDKTGAIYPYDWPYESSDEEEIYKTGELKQYYSLKNSEGKWMFVLGPVFDENGDVIAQIEIGTDLYAVNKANRALTTRTILTAVTAVITILLIFNELIVFSDLNRRKSKYKFASSILFSRILVFLIFFASNMPTAFLPVYAKRMWHEGMIIPVEFAAALPVVSEVFFGAIASVFGGWLIAKFGIRKICFFGSILFVGGILGCATAETLSMLIIANSFVGIGGGVFLVAINTHIAYCEDGEERDVGFSYYNAALLSGVNCGVVVGSLLSSRTSYKTVFYISSIVAMLTLIFIHMYMYNSSGEDEESEYSQMSTLKFLISPKVLSFFLCSVVPYIIGGYFLLYFFPLFAETVGLSEDTVGQGFLLNGIVAIYLGPKILNFTSSFLGYYKSIIASGLIYVITFLLFASRPTITSCFIAILLLGIADSFGLSSQASYFAEMSEVKKYGIGKSMGVNSVFENIAQTLGPFVFSLMMLGGIETSTFVFAGIMLLLLVVFAITNMDKESTPR